MSKKKPAKRPNLSPAAFLRIRLDTLWSTPGLPQESAEKIAGDLEVLARGVTADFFLSTLLRASLTASEAARARLDTVIPAWLVHREYAGILAEAIQDGTLEDELLDQATRWLQAADVEVPVVSPQETFYKAFHYSNEFQGLLMIFWYANVRKTKAQGMGFLLDYNPPWEGAVKDIALYPKSSPEELVELITTEWEDLGMFLEAIDATQAATELVNVLLCNRAQVIRLPKDLISARDPFIRHVLPLLKAPDLPVFTAEDFDQLSQEGKTPEELIFIEHTQGGRMRLSDGKEILVMRDDDDWGIF